MKYFISIALLMTVTNSIAQTYVQDLEHLFTAEEVKRIDSVLSRYHQQTGNYLLLTTDSTNIDLPDYKNPLFAKFWPDESSGNAVLMLTMCRTHSKIKIFISKPLTVYFQLPQLAEMLNEGLPYFKEKKREQAVMAVFQKAIQKLDALPKF